MTAYSVSGPSATGGSEVVATDSDATAGVSLLYMDRWAKVLRVTMACVATRRHDRRMCGIAGLFAKSERAELELGDCLADMIEQLAGRGPDSAGVAV